MTEAPTRPTDRSPTYNIFAERAWTYMDYLEKRNIELLEEVEQYKSLLAQVRDCIIEIETNIKHLAHGDWYTPEEETL